MKRWALALVLLLPFPASSSFADSARVDVSVSGPASRVGGLDADDFRLAVGTVPIELRSVTQTCVPGAGGGLVQPASYLFYFDHQKLSEKGRRRHVALARRLAAELFEVGGRVAIVSNGQELETLSGFTADAQLIERALRRMADDPMHGGAAENAPVVEADRSWRAERNLHRVDLVLERFVDAEPPGIVLYFSDRLDPIWSLSPTTEQALDDLVETAAANLIRFYVVQPGSAATDLGRLAAQTTGSALSDDLSAAAIVAQIRRDLGCIYILGFDTAGLPMERSLGVNVHARDTAIELATRKRIFFRGGAWQTRSRLLARFRAANERVLDQPIQAHVIPTDYDFDTGNFEATMQIIVPGIPQPGGRWDILARFFAPGGSPRDFTGSVDVGTSTAPVVVEHGITFAPGPYEVAMVAHHNTTGWTTSRFVTVSWPDVKDQGTVIGPIAVMQEGLAHWAGRATEAPHVDLIALPRYRALRTNARAVFVGIVCGTGDAAKRVQVLRHVLGERSWAMRPPVPLRRDPLDCVVLADTLPAGTLEPGFFRFEVRVTKDGRRSAAPATELARRIRAFSATDPDR